MQRWLSTLLGLAAFGLAVAVVVRTMSDRPAAPSHADARADAALVTDAGKAHDAGLGAMPPLFADGGVLDTTVAEPSGTAFAKFPDGRPVPPLPDGAPKRVKLGVVLVSFAGAQGAPPNARAKAAALELATKLASDAKSDFHGAVVRGDSGSTDDVGRIPRGILEPSVEYMVFTLPVGGVSDVIETPRGFWIAKRTE